jgi:hypothetical protein
MFFVIALEAEILHFFVMSGFLSSHVPLAQDRIDNVTNEILHIGFPPGVFNYSDWLPK